VASESTDTSDEQFRANRFAIVSRLADDLAHEIKNPLNSIVINLEVLKVRVGKGDAAAAQDRALVIEEEVRRLHRLIDRMLLLMRPERQPEPMANLDGVLDELVPLLEAQVRLARNQLDADCAVPVVVPVRRDVLRFALLNVILAVHGQLGEGGGTLRIRCTPDASQVSIAVDACPDPSESGEPPPADAPDAADEAAQNAEVREAADVATALLADAGGSARPTATGAVLSLPRLKS
jgi:signal transduction histidine kinase